MKMKSIFLISALSLLAVSAIGVGVGLQANNKAEKVEAAKVPASGSVVVNFKDTVTNWNAAGAKLAIYFWNDNGDGEGHKSEGWSNVYALSSSLTYTVEYNLDFTPAKMIIVRQNSSSVVGEQGSWDDWGQSVDLNFSGAIWLVDSTSSPTATLAAQVRSDAVTSFGTKAYLTNFNDDGTDGHYQSYGYVTFADGEKFKVLNDNDGTWSNAFDGPAAVKANFKIQDDGQGDNIVCLAGGTYEIFYDTLSNTSWITRQDIVDADGWAVYFNANVGCDSENGILKPTGWKKVSDAYADLSGDAKDYIYGATANASGDNLGRALATYDWAITHNPNLGLGDRFIVDSHDAVRTPVGLSTEGTVVSVSENNTAIIIVLASIVTVAALGGYFLLKKRKED